MNSLYERYHVARKLQKRIIASNDFTYHEILSFLLKNGTKNQKFLDIGCGVGTVDFYLASKGANVLGIDVSENAVLTARRNAQSLGLNKEVRFEAMNFPKEIPRGRFNVVICSEVLEHLKEDKIAIRKIRTLLVDKGIVIASSPSLNAPLYKIGLLRKFDLEVGHLRRYNLESYIKLFEDAGFRILETKKTEGVLRNFLFTNRFGGFLLRILNKQPFSEVVTFIDNLAIPIFGESNFYMAAKKK